MDSTNIVDKFFQTAPVGTADSQGLRLALSGVVARAQALTNAQRLPAGALQAVPPAFAHKLLNGALKVTKTLSQPPTESELAVAKESVYAAVVEYLRATCTPLPVDMDKPTLKTELSRLLVHAAAFDLAALAGADVSKILGESAAKDTVCALLNVMDDANAPALRRACELVRLTRGLSEEYAPKRLTTEQPFTIGKNVEVQ